MFLYIFFTRVYVWDFFFRAFQEIARVAKKFRRLAERHALESMTSASNRLRAHLHAVVSRGVQEGGLLTHTALGDNATDSPGTRSSWKLPRFVVIG